MLAAETAQGLPNDQLFYAFLRGAAKMYGLLVWGNGSVYNRFGFKTCPSPDACSLSGSSLALLKRLMYSQIVYGAVVFGYEAALQTADKPPVLTPLGKMQAAGERWVKDQVAQGNNYTMVTTVGVLLDFFAGYTPSRHLYTSKVYRVWGNLPYEPHDHAVDGVTVSVLSTSLSLHTLLT